MTRLDDPALVALEYGDDTRLRRRTSVFSGAGTEADARVPAVATHLQEVRDLVGSGLAPSTFTSESGAALLAPHFASVRRIDVAGAADFPTRDEVEAYVRASIAMGPFVDNLPERIAEPLRARRLSSVFVATR